MDYFALLNGLVLAFTVFFLDFSCVVLAFLIFL